MRASWRGVIGAVGPLVLAAAMVGCGGKGVPNPMSPQQARAQVIDAGKEMVRDLGLQGQLVKTVFSYESCTDNNKGPFRGKLAMQFWMPGASRSHPVDPATVYTALRQHGWQSDSDFHSHSVAMQKDGVVAVLDVYNADPPAAAHVGVEMRGQCRDTYDHSKDPFDWGDVTTELQSQ